MNEELHYTPSGVSQAYIDHKLDEFWGELQKPDSDVTRHARETGIPLEALRDLERRQAVTVEFEGSGLDPVATALIVSFAPIVAKIVRDLWDNVFLPRILREKGANALVPKAKIS